MAQVERQREERGRNGRGAKSGGRGKRADATARYELSADHLMHLAALTHAFATSGGAVRIGLTRDGGALAIGCYAGDDYGTEYVRPSEDIGRAVAEIAEAWLPDGVTALQYGYNALQPSNR